jgi:hypothetical protein
MVMYCVVEDNARLASVLEGDGESPHCFDEVHTENAIDLNTLDGSRRSILA